MRRREALTTLLLATLLAAACSSIESDDANDERFGRTQTGALEASEGADGTDGSGSVDDDLADLLAGIPPEERDEVRSEVEALLAELSDGDSGCIRSIGPRRSSPRQRAT
jgi:ABC-type phosphate/phosphonate transport system substrate-binding protein